MTSTSQHSENLVKIKDHLKSLHARGECATLAECKEFVKEVVTASEAQAAEDFPLLGVLTEQVSQVGAEHLLPALTVGAPVYNTDTRDMIDSILHAQERGGPSERESNTGVAAESVRRKVNQRLIDLIDIVAVCRAERIKLLAELVTASRNRPNLAK